MLNGWENFKRIKKILKDQGWKSLPQFGFQSSLMMLSSTPSSEMPVLPKFHRDRLPVAIFSKSLNDNERLVLELWDADYVTPNNVRLWAGTLRQEQVTHPLPLVTLYQESTAVSGDEILENFMKNLERYHDTSAHIIHPASVNNIKSILLLRTQTNPGITDKK